FNHHLAHAANAAYTSAFEEALCMVVDGQGEWGSISYYHYREGRLKLLDRVKGPESLGILYAVSTTLCGFDPEKGEEWKVMGLAPYGKLDEEILDAYRSLVEVDGLQIRYPSLPEIETWFVRMR